MLDEWSVLVNRNGGHNKFWAYNTNRIRWGRIGSVGVELICDYDVIRSKIDRKLSRGYRFATDEELAEYFPKRVTTFWEV